MMEEEKTIEDDDAMEEMEKQENHEDSSDDADDEEDKEKVDDSSSDEWVLNSLQKFLFYFLNIGFIFFFLFFNNIGS